MSATSIVTDFTVHGGGLFAFIEIAYDDCRYKLIFNQYANNNLAV